MRTLVPPSKFVSFWSVWKGKTFISVEGNTESGLNAKGEVERDGGGVYMVERSSVGTKSFKVYGFIKPF